MTRLLSSPSVATPTQRNRRLLLTLPAAVALPSLITACGGGADLSYTTEQALYVVGEVITPNTPQLSTPNANTNGHKAPTFSVWPPLPAGLTLNAQTGVIAGTPTKLGRQSTHTVIATNNRGVAETKIRITVTARGAWTSAAASLAGRQKGCTGLLPDGRVLVVGGRLDVFWSTRPEVYDPIANSWTMGPEMRPRADPIGVVMRDGRMVVFGGGSNASETTFVDIYDPGANIWTAASRMNEARRYAASCLLVDGKVFVSGGLYNGATTFNSVEVYDPEANVWTPLPNAMADERHGHAALPMPDGKSVLLVGGTTSASGMTRMELYALDGSASKLIPSPVTGLNPKAVLLDDGSVLITTNAAMSWRFNPRTSTWKTSAQTAAREFAQTTLLSDGRVLRAGGVGLSTAEIYNPDVNIWTAAAPMAVVRHQGMAARLADGRVLMVNGIDDGQENSAELYTP